MEVGGGGWGWGEGVSLCRRRLRRRRRGGRSSIPTPKIETRVRFAAAFAAFAVFAVFTRLGDDGQGDV